ncbi:hypothetical protein [Cellulophaga baltica]|uniref:hypothetical protein n=1 Tax=Cellulophaga baltica TaxID=76594 RepID=UPI0015F741E1|nr:hypothetical protein [Cellulophaga baltica]MBA6316220.1 hypothetical protein [Cellulophaga baltica]
MKKNILILTCLILSNLSIGQKSENGLKLISDYSSDNPEISDILDFEEIQYLKLKFIGKELSDKSYKLTVKEIWDGKIVRDTTVFDSKNLGLAQFEKVNDTILRLKVISKLTHKNKLRMTFKFPRFSITKEYDAIESHDYSLRNIPDENNFAIKYNEKFYLLAYILPYEREDGSKSWCEVGTSGKEIEKWGEKFGIKHYLLFEMLIE